MHGRRDVNIGRLALGSVIIYFHADLADRRDGNVPGDDAHAQSPNVFERIAQMGNRTIASANEQNLTEMASFLKVINHTTRELKEDVMALQLRSPTESEATPQKRLKPFSCPV